jgi:hypothetical protein
MGYIVQICVMLGDLALIAAAAYIIYFDPTNLFFWVIALYAFTVWQKQGGFMAWNPKEIKNFLKNAKIAGL